MRLRVLTRFPKAREKTCPRAKNPSPARFKGHILPVGTWPTRQELPRATASDSGAAVRLTRDGELGWALGCDCSLGTKTVAGFRAALGRAVGRAFAVRRTAGLARWAFGPPGERAARTRKNRALPNGLKPAGPAATSVAGLRWGRLRPARFFESQASPVYSERQRN